MTFITSEYCPDTKITDDVEVAVTYYFVVHISETFNHLFFKYNKMFPLKWPGYDTMYPTKSQCDTSVFGFISAWHKASLQYPQLTSYSSFERTAFNI